MARNRKTAGIHPAQAHGADAAGDHRRSHAGAVGDAGKSHLPLAVESFLAPALRQELESRLNTAYDVKLGGWETVHKFIDWDALEYTMLRARSGDAKPRRGRRQTLNAGLKLIDPVWGGGVSQYSVEGELGITRTTKSDAISGRGDAESMPWLLRIFTPGLPASRRRMFTATSTLFSARRRRVLCEPGRRPARRRVRRYNISPWMTAAGVSTGVPGVDQHLYAARTAWAIRGLISLLRVDRRCDGAR